jgi:hypothetical protein
LSIFKKSSTGGWILVDRHEKILPDVGLGYCSREEGLCATQRIIVSCNLKPGTTYRAVLEGLSSPQEYKGLRSSFGVTEIDKFKTMPDLEMLAANEKNPCHILFQPTNRR